MPSRPVLPRGALVEAAELFGEVAGAVEAAGGGNFGDAGGGRGAEQSGALHETVFQQVLHRTVADGPMKAAQTFSLAQSGGLRNVRERDRLGIGGLHILLSLIHI